MTGWQPIETAPKDGTPILAYCPHDKVPWRVVKWMQFILEDPDGEWFDAAMKQPVDDDEFFFRPTRWKPLDHPVEPTA